MKVIALDNFDRDHISDVVVVENLPLEAARLICERKNEKGEPNWFYVVRPDDYKPYVFQP